MDFKVDALLFFHAETFCDTAYDLCNALLNTTKTAEGNIPSDFPLKLTFQEVCEEIYGNKEYLTLLVDDVATARRNIESLGVAKLPPKPKRKRKEDKKSIIDKLKESGANIANKFKSKNGLMKEIIETGAVKSNKYETILSNTAGAQKERNEYKRRAEILIAKANLGNFPYAHDGQNRDPYAGENAKTDCSGFMWYIAKEAGFNVPEKENMWYTGSMAVDAKGDNKYLTLIAPEDTQAGDFIVANRGVGVGSNGHTAMLLEPYHGPDTKIIHETSGGTANVQEGVIGSTGILSGSGGAEVIFARPIK